MRLSALFTSPRYLPFFNRIFYIQLTAESISVRHIGTPYHFDDSALLALNRQQQIIDVGARAEITVREQPTGARLVRVFAHPRLLIAEPVVATRLFTYALLKSETPGLHLIPLSTLGTPLKPVVIAHPQRQFVDGLTPMEIHSLRACLQEAGARQVYVWTGPILTDEAIRTGKFPGPVENWSDRVPPWAQV